MRAVRFFTLFATIAMCAVPFTCNCAENRSGELVYSLLTYYSSATRFESPEVRVDSAQCGGKRIRSIYLHPPEGRDAKGRIEYRVRLPRLDPNEKLLFLSYIGLRDGFLEQGNRTMHDGAGFSLIVDKTSVFRMVRNENGWYPIAADLTEYGERDIVLALAVDSVKYAVADWAVWGNPVIIKTTPRQGKTSLPDSTPIRSSSPGLQPELVGVEGFLLFDIAEGPAASDEADSGGAKEEAVKSRVHVFMPVQAYGSFADSGLYIPDRLKPLARFRAVVYLTEWWKY